MSVLIEFQETKAVRQNFHFQKIIKKIQGNPPERNGKNQQFFWHSQTFLFFLADEEDQGVESSMQKVPNI